MKIKNLAWRLIFACAALGFARCATAQTQLTASAIATMPNNACDNVPPPSFHCHFCDSAGGYELFGLTWDDIIELFAQGIGSCDCELERDAASPFGVEQSMSQGFSAVLDSGAVRPGTVPGGCSSCGAGSMIPANSQMIRVELPRIWRSTWTHDGNLGTGMYTGYDYYVTYAANLIEIRDPNTGYIERFIPSGGTPAWAPAPGVTYGSSASYSLTGGTAAHVTIVQPGGSTLFFDQTAYAPTGAFNRCRLNYIADRNGNKINFTYQIPDPNSNTTINVMMFSQATDAYGRTATFHYWTTPFNSLNVLDKVTFSDGRYVTYAYTSDNAYFVLDIEYFPSGGTATTGSSIASTWYAPSGGAVSVNEALLPPDHYNWQVSMDGSSYGRVRGIQRSDGNYAYARAVSTSGGSSTVATWNKGVVRQLVHSPTQQLISSQKQLLDGSWETPITFTTPSNYVPPTAYTQPAITGVLARTTSAVRDPVTNLVTKRIFADSSSERYAYNGYNEPTSYVDQLSNTSSWTYDGSGNMLSHTVAAGTALQVSESWTYTTTAGSAGRMLNHTDFNGNVTSFVYFASSGTAGAAGELQAIVLPGNSGSPQPSGTVSFTYDGFGRVATVTDPSQYARKVIFTYDAAGRFIHTLYADGSTEQTAYNTSAGSSAQIQSTLDRNATRPPSVTTAPAASIWSASTKVRRGPGRL
jgi:YD repeat-containing protein